MKPGDNKVRKSDADPVKETGNDNPGVDFLIVLQVGGCIIAAAVMIYLTLHYILHVI
jgi:hypothetical protein